MDTVVTNSEAWISSTQLLIPLIAVIGTIIVAFISSYATYRFTRKMQLEAEWRKDKLIYYSQLIESMTEMMSIPKDYVNVCKQYAHAYNIISLIAPQEVANIAFNIYAAQQSFLEQENIRKEKKDEWRSNMRRWHKQLVLAMRRDLRIKPSDDPKTFQYLLRSPLHSED